jgi:hypothetical protein
LLPLKRTPMGQQIRVVTQKRRMAGTMDVRTGWIDAMAFGLGGLGKRREALAGAFMLWIANKFLEPFGVRCWRRSSSWSSSSRHPETPARVVHAAGGVRPDNDPLKAVGLTIPSILIS